MLVNKKLKVIQEKPKVKISQNHSKKVKKQKNISPSKIKVTPQKKRVKKDQNIQYNKLINISQSQTQYKSKQSQRYSNNHKKSQNRQGKSKLLTTSPIPIRIQNSKSKQKSKSKSRSVSKPNTYRSTQDKDIFNKSINKKLYSQYKQNRSKSKDKSKSKSRLKTDRDYSPLKQIKQIKKFDVADRQIKYNKNETNQLKKTMKKKIQNIRTKVQQYIQPVQEIQKIVSQPKVKLKKRVPQIKTQFSQRRGSYFDENLLKKLQINHQQAKRVQFCPFTHIKSNFEQRLKDSLFIQQKHELKSQQIPSISQVYLQNQKVQLFKRQQQKRWNLMLSQLKNLKNEPKVSQRIDYLIQYLNQNYATLQQKAQQLTSPYKSIDSNIVHNLDEQTVLKHKSEQLSFNKIKISKNQYFSGIDSINQIQYQRQIKSNESSLKFLSPIVEDKPKQLQLQIDKQILKQQQKRQQIIEKQIQDDNQLIFKRSNNINLSQFYNFIQRNQGERKIQFEPFIKFQIQKIPYKQLIIQQAQHKISDRNILKDLNFLDSSQEFIEIPHNFKDKTTQFKQEMQKIRKNGDPISIDQDYVQSFHNQVKIHDDMSSQSMLLNVSDNNNAKTQKIVDEIQQALILQFCVIILRSKSILHNFITTYTQLVQNQAITVQVGYSDPKNLGQTSNDYVVNIIHRLINHIEVNYKQSFMQQVKLPFQCRPIDILRYIRSTQEDLMQHSYSSKESNLVQTPYFNQEMIEQFQIEVLKNQYFIPGYFSFNHCIYDELNDIFEQLRPYGTQGKAIFSLQLGHPIKDFQEAKKQINSRVQKHLSEKYYEQKLVDEKLPNSDGIFELIYFTSVQVLQAIFEQQTFEICKTLKVSNFKGYAN